MFAILCGCILLLFLAIPYIVAEKFRITNSFVIDVILSYFLVWWLNIFGLGIYILISVLKNKI